MIQSTTAVSLVIFVLIFINSTNGQSCNQNGTNCLVIPRNENDTTTDCSSNRDCAAQVVVGYLNQTNGPAVEVKLDASNIDPVSGDLIVGMWITVFMSPDKNRIESYLSFECAENVTGDGLFSIGTDVQDVRIEVTSVLAPGSNRLTCGYEVVPDSDSDEPGPKSFDLRNKHHLMLEYGHLDINGDKVSDGKVRSEITYKFRRGTGSWVAVTGAPPLKTTRDRPGPETTDGRDDDGSDAVTPADQPDAAASATGLSGTKKAVIAVAVILAVVIIAGMVFFFAQKPKTSEHPKSPVIALTPDVALPMMQADQVDQPPMVVVPDATRTRSEMVEMN